MRISEEILQAMNGIDDSLLEKSEGKKPWKAWFAIPLTAAAVIAMFFLVRPPVSYDSAPMAEESKAAGYTPAEAVNGPADMLEMNTRTYRVHDSAGKELTLAQYEELAQKLCSQGIPATVIETDTYIYLEISTEKELPDDTGYTFEEYETGE